MLKKFKRNNKATLLGLFLTLVLASCLSETKFEDPSIVDTSKPDASKTDFGKPDATKKPDVAQTDCDPKCGAGEVCKTDDFTCVECLMDDNCTNQFCDSDSNTCVDCKDNSTCTEVDASLCTDGNCGACVMDTDCAHLPETPRCDGGECRVACETDAHCGGKVCDLTTNKCTTMPTGLWLQCESCVSDTQCAEGHNCVPLDFPKGTPRDNYCLKISTAQSPCKSPYTIINRKSLGDVQGEYCGIKDSLTTCEAVLVGNTLVDCKKGNIDAGDESKCVEEGSICREYSPSSWRCTYNCDDDVQCPLSCVNNDFCI